MLRSAKGALRREIFERKMAEKLCDAGPDRSMSAAAPQDEVSSPKQTPKRCSSTSPEEAPPHKSPRTGVPSPIKHLPNAGEPQSESVEEPTGPPGSPPARRKSWRRATMTRRSLPALPNIYQVLCRSISTSLSHQERLEKLMEASMKLAIERTQNSLQSVPKASLDTFHNKVEHLKKEWTCLARIISSEHPTSTSSDSSVQRAMEKVRKATNRLQGESECWEALLKKHQTRAEELKRKVEQGLERGVLLDSTSVAQSSQHHFIQSKPDYRSVLRRQQPMLHTMAMIMDIQSKMVRELMFFKDQSQLLVKETSSRLVAEAGFQDLSPDIIRKLIAAPFSSAAT